MGILFLSSERMESNAIHLLREMRAEWLLWSICYERPDAKRPGERGEEEAAGVSSEESACSLGYRCSLRRRGHNRAGSVGDHHGSPSRYNSRRFALSAPGNGHDDSHSQP